MNIIKLKRWVGLWIANSGALLFSSAPSIFTVGLEFAILGLSAKQVLALRIAYNIPKYALSPVSGMITDFLRRKFVTKDSVLVCKVVIDGVALSLYQIPIYIPCALFIGADSLKVALMCLWYFVSSLLFGRFFYGLSLDWIRARFPLLKSYVK